MAPRNVRLVQRTRPATPPTLAEAALNSLADAVLCVDRGNRITYANTAAERLTGCGRRASEGRPLTDFLRLEAAGTMGNVVRTDGQTVPVDTSSAPIMDDRGEQVGTVVTIRDVSVALEASRQLSYIAHHDALTGLPNRTLLHERLSAALADAHATGGAIAVCFLDVDGLKSVNDVFGHSAGDLVLTSTAARLAAEVGPLDTVSRYGGDEFVVVLGSVTSAAEARRTAAALAQAVATPHALDGHFVRVAASLGLALFPEHGRTPEELIARADVAMYAAKRAGSGYREADDEVTGQAGVRLRQVPAAFVARRRASSTPRAARHDRAS